MSIESHAGVPQRPAIEVVVVRKGSCSMLINRGVDIPHDVRLFEIDFWREKSSAQAVGTGRGTAWFVDHNDLQLVLRHFRRGGFMQHVPGDNYFYTGEQRSRSFAEFALLSHLWSLGLPVPEPIGAMLHRRGPIYTADLLTRRIPGAHSWSTGLVQTVSNIALWEKIGRTIAQFHRHGVCHADLNAHNILVDQCDNVFLIDFDKGKTKSTQKVFWRARNLARLQRSLKKLIGAGNGLVTWHGSWLALQAAYDEALSGSP